MPKPDMLLWLDDHRGVYIPRDFANSFVDRDKAVANVSVEDWAILEAGPDHDLYWDTWDDVLRNAIVTDENGVTYTLHQDGALWLIPDGMEWNDESESFDYPEDRENKPIASVLIQCIKDGSKREGRNMEKDTLDQAYDTFATAPNNRTAGNYLRLALEYECDEAISTETLLDIVGIVRDYLLEQ